MILMAGMERGLTMSDMRKMQLGQIVDFCIEYNEREKKAQKARERRERGLERRRASQADFDAFFG